MSETDPKNDLRILVFSDQSMEEATEPCPDEEDRRWETAIIQMGSHRKSIKCGRAFTKRDCIQHKELLDKAKKSFLNFDNETETVVDHKLIQDIFLAALALFTKSPLSLKRRIVSLFVLREVRRMCWKSSSSCCASSKCPAFRWRGESCVCFTLQTCFKMISSLR